jgi:hypothetical protein
MNSQQFDSYLRLENPFGQQVAEDDDGGGFPNAKIVYLVPQSGNYRIIATSFNGGLGAYDLIIEQFR